MDTIEIQDKKEIPCEKEFKNEKEFEKWIQEEKDSLEREKRRIAEERKLFEQKLEILKVSYMQLDADKRKFEREKLQFEAEKDHMNRSYTSTRTQARAVSLFFKGVTNPLALKKRYKDLIKIFHPDNLCGDKETLQMINQEYESLLQDLEEFKEA